MTKGRHQMKTTTSRFELTAEEKAAIEAGEGA